MVNILNLAQVSYVGLLSLRGNKLEHQWTEMFFDKLISAFAGALISELIKNCSGILRTILLGEVEGIA